MSTPSTSSPSIREKPTFTDPVVEILREVGHERARQENLKAAGKFEKTCADDLTNPERLAVLAEEFGEAARAVCEGVGGNAEAGRTDLRKELVQVAAVAVAWIEGLDRG